MSTSFWITSVSSWENRNPSEVIQYLVRQEKIYALKESSHGRKLIKPEDWICFYVPGKGISAHARIATTPERIKHIALNERYPWVFSLKDISVYIRTPVNINVEILEQLDAFKGKDLGKPWSWFVQSTKRVSLHDFEILVQHKIQI